LLIFFFILLYVRSTKGIKRLSQKERIAVLLPEKIIENLTGIMLSDGHIQRRSVSANARFMFNQSGKVDKRPYFELVYSLFKFCCHKDYEYSIRIWLDKKSNQEYSSISFATMQLPCFTKIHSLWYLNGLKKVPMNIKELLTPLVLAHWIMGDGSRQNKGLHLSVYAFTIEDVKLLINVLETKFDLKCSIHKHSTICIKPRIYIWEKSRTKLRILVSPYIIPSMQYKIQK